MTRYVRLFIGAEPYDVPVDLLPEYQEVRVRRAIEGFVSKPLQRPGIEELVFEDNARVIEHVAKAEESISRAPEADTDVAIDDTRRAAYTLRDLSFDEDGTWKLFDGTNPIKTRIEDRHFVAGMENNEIRFANNDVLVCSVNFVQRRTRKELETITLLWRLLNTFQHHARSVFQRPKTDARSPMKTLKQARELGKVDEFAAKREADTPPGDEAALNRALLSMAGKSNPVPGTSKPDRSDD